MEVLLTGSLGGISVQDFFIGLAEGTFAIAVAAYLLIRMECRLDDLTSAIARLEAAILGISGVRREVEE